MSLNITAALAEARGSKVFWFDDARLQRLPSELRDIPDLRELHVIGCEISKIPEWINEFQELELLEVGNNPIGALPLELGQLRSLRVLGLSSTSATGLGVLEDMEGLEVLSLTSNNLDAVGHWVRGLRNLRVLDLGSNPLESISPEISALAHLRQLYLWGHRLDEVPESLNGLSRLELLDVSQRGTHDLFDRRRQRAFAPAYGCVRTVGSSHRGGGDISELPDWLANGLPALKALYAGGQHISSLPASVPTGLTGVYLGSNRFSRFPDVLLDLPDLRDLELHNNAIEAVPVEIRNAPRLSYLALADNPLPIPPEVVNETTSPTSLAEFIDRAKGPTKPLNQAKLLVVGEGSVGKTSLIRRLVDGTFSPHEDKTEGIAVSHMPIDADGDQIALNVWDFGGQEIMHATHQFFLTKRSLYVLVIDTRQGEEQNRIEYWLKLIQSFSDSSPVLIVANKSEPLVLDLDTRGLVAKYPNIAAILPASCKSGEGVSAVTEELARLVDTLPHVRDPLPAAFLDIKRELEQLEVNYLPYSEYQALCTRHHIDTSAAQELLVGFLHDLGTVLCFRDDPRLSDTNILNPRWVTGGVYRLLNSHLAAQRKGLLTWSDVQEILDTTEYPPERRAFIAEMMKRFELCYEAEGTLLVPDLLTKEEPDTGSWDDALQFEIHYDVLPSSVISRLAVRMHGSISHGTVWRTGLVISMDENRALVRGDREDGVIRIAVSGPANGRRGLLTAIRSEFRAIERTIPRLVIEERVPVPGHVAVWVPYRHLLELESAGHRTVIPQGLVKSFNIRTLLAGVEAPTDRQDAPTDFATTHDVSLTQPVASTEWSSKEAMGLGKMLLIALVVLVVVFTAVNFIAGPLAATSISAVALAATAAGGAFVLRSSDRLSEDGFLRAIKRLPTASPAGEESGE